MRPPMRSDRMTLSRGSRLAAGCLLWAALLFATARPTPAPDASPGATPALRQAYETAASQVLCYCGCSRQTVRDCTCGVAFDLRDAFEKRLAAGESAEGIVAAYLAEHGEQARDVPPKKGINLIAWFGPGIAIGVAGIGTMILIFVWSRRKPPETASTGIAPTAAEESVRRRLEKDLKEFDR